MMEFLLELITKTYYLRLLLYFAYGSFVSSIIYVINDLVTQEITN
jgi:hypothetical protein